ncbi:MAG: alpha/beta hydrolase [Pseudoxanthomonas sp.]|nr:alpha/beta hydrolase [Pseudoxanthomonas sp.]
MVPGIGDSGPGHWQSRWQNADPECVRVRMRDWDYPVCEEWVAAVEDAVRRLGPSTVLVAHSLGCLAVANWAARSPARVRGALLVAVPDPGGPEFPTQANGFAVLPSRSLPFPATMVASSDDPYSSLDFARGWASRWGCRLVEAGAAGHLNAASNLGDWPAGQALLRELRDAAAAT